MWLLLAAALVPSSQGATLPRARAAPQDQQGRLFGVWATGPSTAQLPFLRGGQAMVQWSAVQTQPDTFNFSALDAAVISAVGSLPASREPLFSIQVNGNTHPRFLYEKVPFIPADNSWAAENKDSCPDNLSPVPREGTTSCVLQYWHPYFVEQ